MCVCAGVQVCGVAVAVQCFVSDLNMFGGSSYEFLTQFACYPMEHLVRWVLSMSRVLHHDTLLCAVCMYVLYLWYFTVCCMYLWYFTMCVVCTSGTSLCAVCMYYISGTSLCVVRMYLCTTGRRRHAKDMIVNLSYERERLSQLVKEEEEEMKKLSDILRIVEV